MCQHGSAEYFGGCYDYFHQYYKNINQIFHKINKTDNNKVALSFQRDIQVNTEKKKSML